MRKKQKEIPELKVQFDPTTNGCEPFDVCETIHTVVLNDPIPLLSKLCVYRDSNVYGKYYNLNKEDACKILTILTEFMQECVKYNTLQRKSVVRKTMVCLITLVLMVICAFSTGIAKVQGNMLMVWALLAVQFILSNIFMTSLDDVLESISVISYSGGLVLWEK